MKSVVLLGTMHSIQKGEMQEDGFKSYIKRLCNKYNIKAIAEEINNDAIYIAQTASEELKIKYKIIEPTPEEKVKLNIEKEHHIMNELINRYEIEDWDKEYKNSDLSNNALEEYDERVKVTYRQRENEWLKRINVLDSWPLLVICGDDHSQPFSELLVSSGMNVIIKVKYE